MSSQLAIDGGARTIANGLPSFMTAAGRTFGPEEDALVLEALHSGCLSRNGGRMVKGIERDFAAALGVKHVVLSVATAAVALLLAAAGAIVRDHLARSIDLGSALFFLLVSGALLRSQRRRARVVRLCCSDRSTAEQSGEAAVVQPNHNFVIPTAAKRSGGTCCLLVLPWR